VRVLRSMPLTCDPRHAVPADGDPTLRTSGMALTAPHLVPTGPPRQRGEPARMLVVDDNPGDVELMRIACEMAGLAVVIEVAGDGLAGHQLLLRLIGEGRPPQLVLLDHHMPRLTGPELLALLMGEPATAHIPVVILSTAGEAAYRQHCLRLGAREVVQKPDGIAGLVALIQRLRPYLEG
jgi:chemotaxis family two-component system response regulator Rcp1